MPRPDRIEGSQAALSYVAIRGWILHVKQSAAEMHTTSMERAPRPSAGDSPAAAAGPRSMEHSRPRL